MNKYPDFWSVLLGNGHHGLLFGFIVMAFICAFGTILIMAANKYKGAEGTPTVWSWKYFFANNLGIFGANFFLIPITIRLIYQYIDPTWMLLVSCGLGFGFLALAKIATNFGLLTTNKLSQRIADKINSNQSDKP